MFIPLWFIIIAVFWLLALGAESHQESCDENWSDYDGY